MKLYTNKRRIIGAIFQLLILSSTLLLVSGIDEEDDLLDEIIPHKVFKRKFIGSSPKRQDIMSPELAQGDQYMQMPQGATEQFAGEPLPGGQLPAGLMQSQGMVPETMEEQPGFPVQGIQQAQAMQTLGQTQPGEIMTGAQSTSQQLSNEGVVTEIPENARNYNENAAIETTMSDSGYRVTTDAKEKANSLVKDVKNFGLWEYSNDNTASSTDQTAKILQSKLEEDDALLKGKDSASLNTNQVANAQGSKIDDLLSLFNKGPSESSDLKGLESLQTTNKGLEAIDDATKGFTAFGGVDKTLGLLGTGKSVDGAANGIISTPGNEVASLESSVGNQGLSLGGHQGGHEDVSVVNIPNTYSLEDEHGNSLDANTVGISGNHKVEKTKAMQLLKALLKHKLETQAFKMLLKQKALKAAAKPSASPTKSLKEQLAMFLKHANQGKKADAEKEDSDEEKPEKVSKVDLKLLKFIKKMLRKGAKEPKGINPRQMKLFMMALKGIGKIKSEAENKKDAEDEKEDGGGEVGKADKAEKVEAGKEAGKEKDEKVELKEKEEKKGGKDDKKELYVKQNSKEEKETKSETKTELKSEEKQNFNGNKLKMIQALLKQYKPTVRSGHNFFLDPEQPLNDPVGMTSNSLMKYLEHETALLDQFQEGSQISDPSLQLKKLANLMMKVASKAQTKDAYVDARRTTVSPTSDLAGGNEEGKTEKDASSNDAGKAKGERKTKDKEDKGKDKGENIEEKEKAEKEKEKDSNKKIDKEEKSAKSEDEKGSSSNSEKVESKEKSSKDESSEKKEDKESSSKEKLKQEEEKSEEKSKSEGKEQKFAGGAEEGKGKDAKDSTKESAKEGVADLKNGKAKEEAKEEETNKQEKLKTSESENSKGDETGKEEKANVNNQSDSDSGVKEVKKIPELDGSRSTSKPVEKLDDKGKEESSKLKDGDGGSEKGKEDKKDDADNTKEVKKLPEMNKLRDNKKIVNKIDSSSEKDVPTLKGDDKEKHESSASTVEHAMGFKDKEDASEKVVSKVKEESNAKDDGKSESKQEQKSSEQTERKETPKQEDGESEAHHQSGKETEEQYDLYVTSKSNGTARSGKARNTSANENSESHTLKPQLPFLNPGNAHLDVLENDASLKQYLMQKGTKPGSLKDSKEQPADSENFDYKGNDRLLQLKDVTSSTKNNYRGNGRLLQLKDVTASTKNRIEHKGSKNKGLNKDIQAVKTRPNAVPPAGQGIPISTYHQGIHSIKPMSRLQLRKYKELMAYKKRMSDSIHLRPRTGLMETGSMRHIAPLLADRLVDAPSVRLAALARLISMANRHHKMVDVAASKKTLPSSEHHITETSPVELTASTSSLISPTPADMPSTDLASSTLMTSSTRDMTSSASRDMTSSLESKASNVTSSDVKSHVSNIILPLKSKSVLVPSRKSSTDNDALTSMLHDSEAAPATEISRLVAQKIAGETENGIDASDVTRSRLEKPFKPSIAQAMNLLGNEDLKTGSKKDNLDSATTLKSKDNEAQQAEEKTDQNVDENKSQVSGNGRDDIVNSFFKKPAHSTRNVKPGVDEISSFYNPKGKKLVIPGPVLSDKFRTDNQIAPVHEQEAGISSIRKADVRSIVRTLKTDSDAANFLLRKRSEIPRIRNKHHSNTSKRRITRKRKFG